MGPKRRRSAACIKLNIFDYDCRAISRPTVKMRDRSREYVQRVFEVSAGARIGIETVYRSGPRAPPARRAGLKFYRSSSSILATGRR
jgi:hypothetical protein